MKQDNKQLIIYGGGLLLVYFGVLKPILNKLGVTKSAEDKVVDAQMDKPNSLNPFSSQFYKSKESQNAGAILLKRQTAENFAKIIYDAMGVFSDDEAKVYGVFRALKTQSQVSFLSDVFQQMYKTDLLSFLKTGYSQWNPASGMNADELNVVIQIVNKLPKYKS